MKFVIDNNVTMFDKLLIRMCTFGVIWLTNWNSKLENKYKKNKGEKAVEFHYSPPSQFQIEEIITEKCSNKNHELGRQLGRETTRTGNERTWSRKRKNQNNGEHKWFVGQELDNIELANYSECWWTKEGFILDGQI